MVVKLAVRSWADGLVALLTILEISRTIFDQLAKN
jgi:hypothetical protein